MQAVMEMAGFNSAMSSYLNSVDKMGGESENAARKATSAFDRIGGAIAGVGKAAATFTLAAVVGGVALARRSGQRADSTPGAGSES